LPRAALLVRRGGTTAGEMGLIFASLWPSMSCLDLRTGGQDRPAWTDVLSRKLRFGAENVTHNLKEPSAKFKTLMCDMSTVISPHTDRYT
jgi:hypothetical protein